MPVKEIRNLTMKHFGIPTLLQSSKSDVFFHFKILECHEFTFHSIVKFQMDLKNYIGKISDFLLKIKNFLSEMKNICIKISYLDNKFIGEIYDV